MRKGAVMADGEVFIPKVLRDRKLENSQFVCACGGGMGVTDSRVKEKPTHCIRRRRTCCKCGARMTTREVPEEWVDRMGASEEMRTHLMTELRIVLTRLEALDA